MSKLLLGLSCIFGIVLMSSAIAYAGNFGSSGSSGVGGTTNGVWRTNNNNYVIAERNLTPAVATAINNIESVYDATDLNYTDVVSNSCSDALRDTCAYDSHYGNNGFIGWNSCWGTVSGSHPNQQCSVTWVRFNLTYSANRTSSACHEVGHSIGLRHRASVDTCMNVPSSVKQSLGAHDVDHINLFY